MFYWLLVVVTLINLKWKEGRFAFFGKWSKAHYEREERAIAMRAAPERQHPVGTDEEEDDKVIHETSSSAVPTLV